MVTGLVIWVLVSLYGHWFDYVVIGFGIWSLVWLYGLWFG